MMRQLCFSSCSWHLAAVIACLLAILSILHILFLPSIPFIPNLLPLSAPSPPPPPSPLEDGHGGILFRNTPWRNRIGEWLSHCYQHSTSIPIHETVFGSTCPNDCSGQGVCNQELGQCRCFHGFSGSGCEERLNMECNLQTSSTEPFGPWIVSICTGYCDKTRAMCFCGDDFKYPNRPVAEGCGFTFNGSTTDWMKPDWDSIYSNDSNTLGWCNIDPKDGYDGKAKPKKQCDCKYDCSWGRFCEITTQCVCINQCMGNGYCRGGSCQCKEGWYGVDCSLPSVFQSPMSWPDWMRTATINISKQNMLTKNIGEREMMHSIIRRKRPLVYIYDLPPEFNSHLLEGRHWKLECTNRIYDYANATFWTDQLYGAEIALYESMLASPHRTTNADEADFFYVPVLGACLITRADDSPHLLTRNHMGLRTYLTLDFYKRAYFHIMQSYPYWNTSDGHDHIWFFSWDEGACYAPKEIWNSMMLVHWGNTNQKYNYSTTCYYADNWNNIPIEERGEHPCYDPEKDLVLPAWKTPDPYFIAARLWERPRTMRKNLFYFNGNLGNAYDGGRPEINYSMGIRQKLAEEFGSSPNKEGKLGKHAAADVVVTSLRSPNYADDLASSIFCGVLPGDGWSGRMEDSILHGCIPVIIQDGIHLPYENILNYDSFAIRLAEKDIPQMVQILRAIDDTELDFKVATIQKIWQRYTYHGSIMLEARRQKALLDKDSGWALQFGTLKDDDAFSTLMQALHYKLYNDAWRLEGKYGDKQHGLPKQCERT